MQSIRAAENLEVLCWTRTGSLSDRVILSMFEHMHQLRRLELTGNSRTWSPALLATRLPPSVRDLSFILPDRAVLEHIPLMLQHLDAPLQGINLLCMDSSLVTDAWLSTLATLAPSLQRLSLVGCKQVHGEGLRALVTPHLREVALESLALEAGVLSSLALRMPHLTSLTVTYPKKVADAPAFFQEVSHIWAMCHRLHTMVLYARGGSAPVVDGNSYVGDDSDDAEEGTLRDTAPRMSTACLHQWAASPAAATLRVLRMPGVGVSLGQLSVMTSSPIAQGLRELVVQLYEYDMDTLGTCLAACTQLRTFHMFSHLRSDAQYTEADMLRLAQAGGPNLTHIGFRNRVWLVEVAATGERVLRPWDKSAGLFPSSMLVVRS